MADKKNAAKLTVGLGSELTIQVEGIEERFKAVLVGMAPSEYLIVRMLLPSKLRGQIDKGTFLVVRYIYMGNVYGFRSELLGSTMIPFKLTFLSYPLLR